MLIKSKILIKNINLLPLNSEIVHKNKSIIVDNGKILKILDGDLDLETYNGYIIDGKNSFVLPGLSDMHMHFTNCHPELILKLYLINGVTTIRSMAGNRNQLELREKVNSNLVAGPRIIVSSPIIDSGGVNEDNRKSFDTPEEVDQAIITIKEQGYDLLKLYTFLKKDVFDAVMKKAQEFNLYVSGHIPYALGLEGVIKKGMNEIAHIEELLYEFLQGFDRKNPKPLGLKIDYSRMPEVIKLLKESQLSICTSLSIDELIVQKITKPEIYLQKPETKYVPDWLLEEIAQGKDHHQIIFKDRRDIIDWYELYLAILKELKANDIPLILGTDAGAYGVIHGFSVHDELQILVDNGFSPYEAIRAATIDVAINIGEGEQWGTLEEGKIADLIMVQNNPFESISNLKDIDGIMTRGIWYSREYLDVMKAI